MGRDAFGRDVPLAKAGIRRRTGRSLMHRYQSRSWTAFVSAIVLICGPAAVAQQPAPAASGAPAAPPAPPSWAQGRSSAQDKSPLAPHNAPLTAKNAEEIPSDKIQVADGVEV